MGTYTGTALNDTITPETVSAGVTCVPAGSRPSAAADTINGLGGNDYLQGGGGADTINGGTGNDSIWDVGDNDDGFASPNAGNIIHGDLGNDDIVIGISDTGGANPATNRAYGDAGDDNVSIQIWGSDDEEWVGGSPTGTLTLNGGDGDDTLEVVSWYVGLDTTAFLYGGAGADELRATKVIWEPDESFWGGFTDDNLYGGTGDDHYMICEAQDKVFEKPGEGTDTVDAVEMIDYVLPENVENLFMTFYHYANEDLYAGTGNALNNVIRADDAWESTVYVLRGMEGDDIIYGGTPSNDRLYGDAGNDTLYGSQAGAWGGADADTIYGGPGNDLIYGGGGNTDTGDGNDRLYGDDGNDRIFGSFGNDRMYGGTGNDELGGQAGNDTMYGGAGRDRLGGGSGNDALYGDADVDVLSGREGADQLWGGTGNDVFDYDAVTDSRPGAANRDVIFDFVGVGAAVGDRIDLLTIDANTSVGGNQAFVFRGTAAFTGAGQVRVLASGADTLIQANTGGSLAPEMEILVKDGTATPGQWVAGDFIL